MRAYMRGKMVSILHSIFSFLSQKVFLHVLVVETGIRLYRRERRQRFLICTFLGMQHSGEVPASVYVPAQDTWVRRVC